MTTVVIADDHRIVREGVKALFEHEAELCVVGEAGDGLEAVRVTGDLRPDVLIVDLSMPGLGGLEVTREVRKHAPSTQVVVLSMHSDEGYVREALGTGALAYVLKSSTARDLVEAVRLAASGRRYLSPPLSEHAVAAYAERVRATPVDPYDLLTAREREVFRLAAEGSSNADIGRRLSISPRTVEVHRAKLMRKLGFQSYSDLVRFAIRRGIV